MKEVLVIMTAYKRNYFKEQIEAIKNQEGVIIKKILLWQNENHVNVDFLREYDVQIFKSDDNNKYNCIATQNGRTYNHNTKLFDGIGDSGQNYSDIKVDFGGHIWAFKTEWIKYLWMQKQISYETAEDMQFSMMCKFHANIDTYCPKQTDSCNTGNLKLNYSGDEHATYRIFSKHNELRSQIFEELNNRIKNK